MPFPRSALSFLCIALLGGCAGTGTGYPSLAPRPIEGLANQPEPHATPPAATPGPAPAVAPAVAAEVAAADQGQPAWNSALEDARAAVRKAAGSSSGSEAWIAAQVALTRLDDARAPATTALANLDRMAIAAAGGDAAAGVEDALSRVAGIESDQRATFSALLAQLPQP